MFNFIRIIGDFQERVVNFIHINIQKVCKSFLKIKLIQYSHLIRMAQKTLI